MLIGLSGAPERIRTSGLCLRRAALYPAELQVPWWLGIVLPSGVQLKIRVQSLGIQHGSSKKIMRKFKGIYKRVNFFRRVVKTKTRPAGRGHPQEIH